MVFRIGLLGASTIAPIVIIEPAATIDSAEVFAVAARDRMRAEAYADEHNIPHVYDSYEALMASPKIDIIYVGLPPSGHAQWSINALNAGKHVICEKPIAMNAEEAAAMVLAAENSEGRLVEAFHTAYHSSFDVCLKWVREGRIGKIVSMKAHFGVPLEDDGSRNQFRPERGGGSVMDMGCYPLQWVNAMAESDIADIAARAVMADSGVDGSMEATLTYENGIEAQIACSMIGPGGFSAGLTIEGTEGVIEFDNPLVPHNNGVLRLRRTDGADEEHDVSTKTTYQYQLEAILAALKTGGPLPTEGEKIVKQQKLIDAVYHAAGLQALRSSQSSNT